MAPTVSSRARARFLTKLRFSSSSYAALIAVTRLAIPPDAAHSASTMASTDAMPAPVCWAEARVTWSVISLLTSSGRARDELIACSAIFSGWDDQPVDQHHRHQQREYGQEAVERHPGRQQRHLVRFCLGQAALDDLEPALCGDLGGFVGLAAGNLLLDLLSVQLIGSTHEHSVPIFVVIARLWTWLTV